MYEDGDMTFKEQGYLVIPNFINQDEIDAILKEYSKVTPNNNLNYDLPHCTDNIFELLHHKLKAVAQLVDPSINFWVNGFYADTNRVNWGWHQDHEPYYILQQVENYLNFYIPLIKPEADKTGLSIIPLDVIDDCVKKIGACRYEPSGDQTLVHNDSTGETFTLNMNIETVKVSPNLQAGDLLLLRGDVIHKTQDGLTNRVAVSMRCVNSQRTIKKNRILGGCEYKQKIIKYNQQMYDHMLTVFGDQEELSIYDVFQEYGKLL